MPKDIIYLEACVESLAQAEQAQLCGAHRIELCHDLTTGGLTPPDDLLIAVKSVIKIPIMVMVRPRAGNFVYTMAELEEMKQAVDVCKKAGVAGVVFGFLTKEGSIDVEKTADLVVYSKPLLVTFHKAIDETTEILEAVRQLKRIPGIQRILTSGGAPTALEGRAVLKKMMAIAGAELTILVAGKVTKENLPQVHFEIGAREYHGRRIVF